jgi:hypothetical protein
VPEATLASFNLEGKNPGELEQRRREIIGDLQTKYKGWDDPTVPMSLLQELAAVTASLRRKTAGPPKAAKPPKITRPKSIDDLVV